MHIFQIHLLLPLAFIRNYQKKERIAHAEKGVTIINGLSAAGITLSFELAEEIVQTIVLM